MSLHITRMEVKSLFETPFGLGEKDQALADLESARREEVPWMVHMRVTPLLDSLRSDPRFTALMSKVRGRA